MRLFLWQSRGVSCFAGSVVKWFKPSLGKRAQISFVFFLLPGAIPVAVLGNVLGNQNPAGVRRDEALPPVSPRVSLSQIRAGIESIPRFQVSSFDANVASKRPLTNPALRRQRRGGKRVSGIKTLGLAFVSCAFLMASWQPRSSMRNPPERCRPRADAALAPFPAGRAGRALVGINAELQLCPSPWRPNPKLLGIPPIIVLKLNRS